MTNLELINAYYDSRSKFVAYGQDIDKENMNKYLEKLLMRMQVENILDTMRQIVETHINQEIHNPYLSNTDRLEQIKNNIFLLQKAYEDKGAMSV